MSSTYNISAHSNQVAVAHSVADVDVALRVARGSLIIAYVVVVAIVAYALVLMSLMSQHRAFLFVPRHCCASDSALIVELVRLGLICFISALFT